MSGASASAAASHKLIVRSLSLGLFAAPDFLHPVNDSLCPPPLPTPRSLSLTLSPSTLVASAYFSHPLSGPLADCDIWHQPAQKKALSAQFSLLLKYFLFILHILTFIV